LAEKVHIVYHILQVCYELRDVYWLLFWRIVHIYLYDWFYCSLFSKDVRISSNHYILFSSYHSILTNIHWTYSIL